MKNNEQFLKKQESIKNMWWSDTIINKLNKLNKKNYRLAFEIVYHKEHTIEKLQ